MKIVAVKKKTLIIAAILILTVISSISVGAAAVFKPKRSLPIYSVDRSDKKIAISFDCAWGTEFTDKILEILKEKDVKTTFFCVEFWTKKYPEYVKKISDEGHELGTHSATHPKMSTLSREQIIKELTTSKTALEEITGKPVDLFRPPYGDYNNLVIDTSRELGLYPVQWDVDSLDWKNLTASEMYKRVVSRVKSGSIVLFHNNGLHTAEALPGIIDALKNEGFTFVTIGELIYKKEYRTDNTGRQFEI